MKITLYHGDNYNTKEILPPLMLNGNAQAGPGIYFSQNLAIAESYGSNLIKIEVDSEKFFDARTSTGEQGIPTSDISLLFNTLLSQDKDGVMVGLLQDYAPSYEIQEHGDITDSAISHIVNTMRGGELRHLQVELAESFGIKPFVEAWGKVFPENIGNHEKETGFYSIIKKDVPVAPYLLKREIEALVLHTDKKAFLGGARHKQFTKGSVSSSYSSFVYFKDDNKEVFRGDSMVLFEGTGEEEASICSDYNFSGKRHVSSHLASPVIPLSYLSLQKRGRKEKPVGSIVEGQEMYFITPSSPPQRVEVVKVLSGGVEVLTDTPRQNLYIREMESLVRKGDLPFEVVEIVKAPEKLRKSLDMNSKATHIDAHGYSYFFGESDTTLDPCLFSSHKETPFVRRVTFCYDEVTSFSLEVSGVELSTKGNNLCRELFEPISVPDLIPSTLKSTASHPSKR